MDVWEPVLPKDMHGCGRSQDGVPTLGLTLMRAPRIDTTTGFVWSCERSKKAMKRSDVPSAAELFSGMPPLESVKVLLSLFVSHSQEEAKGKQTLAINV